jgi:hypothetical protein
LKNFTVVSGKEGVAIPNVKNIIQFSQYLLISVVLKALNTNILKMERMKENEKDEGKWKTEVLNGPSSQ